jgi:hypothetical protein
MSRTNSVPGIALGRWCTLGQTHYPVLGAEGPPELRGVSLQYVDLSDVGVHVPADPAPSESAR